VDYTCLFFDLDRTLWDYESNARKSLNQIYDSYHLEEFFSSPEEFYSLYDRINDGLWEDYRQGRISKNLLRNERFSRTLEKKGIKDEKLAENIGSEYLEITPRMNILFPNTIPLLDYLSEKGYVMNILTNGFLNTQEKKMKNSGIDQYFDKIFSSEEIGINKPRPEIFHWAVSSLHMKKAACLMIGDDLKVDIEGAVSYGMDGVLFDPQAKSLDNTKKYRIISDLIELTHFL